MNVATDQIIFQLTGKKKLEEVEQAELQQIAAMHPYFPIAQLLLSQKQQQENDPDFARQLQRTALYFPNTLWLDHLLQSPTGDLAQATEHIAAAAVMQQPAAASAERQHHENIQHDSMSTEPEIIKAAPEEEQYAASTTEEVMQQAEDEEKQKEVIASVLEEQLAEFRKPVAADTELKIETEPYHTVDYFASQGIKVDLTQPQDKLGSQLRKFTDWLKQMKNVKTESADLGTDPEVENMIQGIAKSSNETKEIVTETMADVLVKQGKTDKAIQLYIKLSFLNPDKSAYFAAKIEQLKGI